MWKTAKNHNSPNLNHNPQPKYAIKPLMAYFLWLKIMKSTINWQKAFQITLPVAMGYIPAGIAYGVLFVAAGLPAWSAVVSSILIYAGALQYASIPLLASGAGLFTHASNSLAINLRMAFYGIPILKQLPTNKFARLICLYCLTDETFSILTTLEPKQREALMLPISLLNQLYWVVGTILGLIIGGGLNDLVPHLDFALVCLFAILAYEQFSVVKAHYPIVIAMMAFVVVMLFLPSWALLGSIALSAILITLRYQFLTKSMS